MIYPTVHLNGTSKRDLTEPLVEAHGAINRALDKLCKTSPNARDYYPQGPGAYEQARKEHDARRERLIAVREELFVLFEGIEDGRVNR